MRRTLRAVVVSASRRLPSFVRGIAADVPYLNRAYEAVVRRNGLVVRRIVHGPLRGVLFEYDPRSEIVYWWGTYETDLQKWVATLPLEGATAWDIGAHAGFVSLLLARRCARVVAVEPSPTAAARLRANVQLNRANVEVVEAAVGQFAGNTSLREEGRTSRVNRRGEGVDVLQVTLDELAERYGPPDLIKLDVEGAELDALRGGQRVLRAASPRLVIEAHSVALVAGISDLLRSEGYVVEGDSSCCEPFRPVRLLARPATPTDRHDPGTARTCC